MTRPGVYVSEAPLPRVVQSPAPTQSYGAFIGTALRGPTEPVLIRSWSEFNAQFGGFGNSTSLPYAMYQFFANSGTSAYVCRVFDSTGAVKASGTYTPAGTTRLTFEAGTVGAWGNGVDARIYNISLVYNDPPTNTDLNLGLSTFDLEVADTIRGVRTVVERFTRLTMDSSTPRYVESIVNSDSIGSRYISVTVNAPDIEDFTAVSVPLTLGVDGGAPSSADYAGAVDLFDPIDALLVFNLAGTQQAPVTDVSGALSKIEARGDSFLVMDTDIVTWDPDTVTLPASSYVGVYHPWLHIADPAPDAPRGATVMVPPGPSAVGVILRTDASRGVFKAPAGVGSSLGNAVAVSDRLTNAELDELSAMNVNPIRPVTGSGITVMGARTQARDTAQYISVRRTLNYIKKRASIVSSFALFEPNTPSLWEQLRVVNGAFLSELWRNGGLRGSTPAQAFYVKCDSEINTEQTTANGEVHIEIGVAPVFPAEFVIIRVGQFEADSSIVTSEEF